MREAYLPLALTTLFLAACTGENPSGSSVTDRGSLGEARLLGSGAGAVEFSTEPSLERIARNLNLIMRQCPAKLWPVYTWAGKLNVLLLKSAPPAILWHSDTGQIETLPESEIPAQARDSAFSYFPVRGLTTMTIMLTADGFSANEYDALTLAIHEGFHQVGQRDWISDSNRGTLELSPYCVLRFELSWSEKALSKLQNLSVGGGSGIRI